MLMIGVYRTIIEFSHDGKKMTFYCETFNEADRLHDVFTTEYPGCKIFTSMWGPCSKCGVLGWH